MGRVQGYLKTWPSNRTPKPFWRDGKSGPLAGDARGGKWSERLPVRFEWLVAA